MQLFTNLRYVRIRATDSGRGIHTHCAALLLVPRDSDVSPSETKARLRGFGVDAGWNVFELCLEDDAYAVTDHTTGVAVGGQTGRELPICERLRVTFGDGLELLLDAEDRDRAIKIEDCAGLAMSHVWRLLERRTAEFWTRPDMPHLFHGPPGQPELAERPLRQS